MIIEPKSPQVQTVLVLIHLLDLGRVLLDYYVFLVPEYILDEAPLAPVGGTGNSTKITLCP